MSEVAGLCGFGTVALNEVCAECELCLQVRAKTFRRATI